ncbi:YihY/virulence factor BrkB family protein [Pedobacter sp. SYSU D00535]|uniref:YihY/virulence factor BrkB family protein n=1 Tax=Pedobacter sp. SYSU D00535 TaxID=2810308 RepID=UPI001A97314F|nr:YihY/virulence factor BrkB family protein [Pedobacter sp. SYSU D00535]
MQINRSFFKTSWQILVGTYNGFMNDRVFKLSAALSYYTLFSIAPLLLIIISLAGRFYGEEALQGKLFEEINEFIGREAALQVQEIIQNVTIKENSVLAVTTGIITLFIGATGVFVEIQDSINMIWRVKAKPEKGWLKLLKNRLLSFSMIATMGFLLIVSLIINGIVTAFSTKLHQYFPEVTVLLVQIFNSALTFAIITILLGIVFKFLPDVEIKWRDVRAGAIFTALLFMLGRYLITLYIERVGPGSTYGAAGSLIVILVWVYYAAAILYFGAEFTQVYTEKHGRTIRPASYAVHVTQIEEEREVKVLPDQNKENAGDESPSTPAS